MSYDYPIYYKLFLTKSGFPVLVELQEFDEYDYDQNRFISEDRFTDEKRGNAVLESLLLELYNRDVNLETLDHNTAIAITKHIYNSLFKSDLNKVVDNTMERIIESAQLSTIEIKRIRQIISSLVVNINNR